MRLSSLGLAASCIATLSAALGAQTLQPVHDPGLKGTVGGMIEDLARERGTGVRQKVIGVDTSDSAFLFPSAGSVQGAGGTYFRSDAFIVNHRQAMQRISMGFIAQGANNANRPLHYFDLKAGTPYVLLDLVGSVLHESGLGAVLVSGVTASGSFDSGANLDGFSRIWTNQPGAQGTVSLAFPSVALFDSYGNAYSYALGLRHDAGYRTNVGIVNLDPTPHTWTVTVNGDQGPLVNFNVAVDGTSMKQVPVPAGVYGNLLLALIPDSNNALWSAFGASADNITGDGWVSHACQPQP